MPIDRITTAVPILHPNIDTSSVVWQPDVAPVERLWQMTPENIQRRQNSPLQIVYRGGGPVRRRIGAEPEEGEFTVLPDLRAEGIIEYLVLPRTVLRRDDQGDDVRHQGTAGLRG